jgi:hypothetical protein
VSMSPPDAVALVVEYLRAQEYLKGVTVATEMPEDVPGKVPLLLVEVLEELPPSRMPWARVRRTKVGLQAWAGPELGEARLLMRRALATLLAARAVTMPAGQRIERVAVRGEPVDVPGSTAGEDVHRVVAIVEVAAR